MSAPPPEGALLDELRALIVSSAPDPARAAPVRDLDPDAPLDQAIPFSSLIVLGTVVAVEDRFGVKVTRGALERATGEGATLNALARLVRELQAAQGARA